MEIKKKGQRGIIHVAYDPQIVQTLRAMPGGRKWSPEHRAWLFEISPCNLEYLVGKFPQAKLSPEIQEALDKVRRVKRESLDIVSAKDDLSVPETAFKFKTTPYDHQKKVFVMSRDMEAFAILAEMGTGKSKIAIDTCAYLYVNRKIDAMLVIAPNNVKSNWVLDELPTHMPDYVAKDMVSAYWAAAPRKIEREQLEKLWDPGDHLRVLVMNVEAFSSKRGQEYASKFVSMHKTLAVVDESTRIKTPGSIRTKAIIKIGKLCPYRRIMTGTPVTQSPMDIFSQFKFLDPFILGYSSFYSFRNHFAVMGGYEDKEIVEYKNLDELQALVSGHSYRILKSECLDLPDKVYEKRVVELSPAQERAYTRMAKSLVAQIDSGATVSASITLTKLLRLQQIVGGFVPVEDEDAIVPVDENKFARMDALMDVVEELSGKVIIWARFKPEITVITRRLRKKYGKDAVVEFHGGVKEQDRVIARQSFQDPKSQVRFFVGNVQSGGVGLTLTQARTVIYYSNSFSLEDRLQSEDRAHRIGQTNKVTYIDLVAPGTIDEKILGALRDKRDIASTVTMDELCKWL